MPTHYDLDIKPTAEQLAMLFDSSGIRRPTRDLLRIQRMIDNANLVVTAWDGEKLVGIARALTDFCYCCYLSDLAVDKEYQRQGIGRELVERVKSATGEECSLILLSAPDAMSYYPAIGMEQADNAWIIKRKR
jgi:ribosomal protein S18 acetylase RimI-like enzyme